MSRRRHGLPSEAAFTLVEVLMSLAILATGVLGIYSLQMASVRGTSDAQEITTASSIARRFVEMLRRDALRWNDPSPGRSSSDLASDTTYLRSVVAAADNWVTAAAGGDNPWNREGEIDTSAGNVLGQFCVHYRLNWASAALVNQMLRAEVRVWWYRPGGNRTTYTRCGAGNEAAMTGDNLNVRWVYATTAIRRTAL